MANAGMYSQDEIQRRMNEFNSANRRDHARFVLGVAIVTLLMIAGTLLALADF